MEVKLTRQSMSDRSSFLTLIVVVVGCMVITSSISYIFGTPSAWIISRLFNWVSVLVIALLLSKLCHFISLLSKRKILVVIPYLALIPSLLYSLDFLITRSNDDYALIQMYFYILSFIGVLVRVFILVVLARELNWFFTQAERVIVNPIEVDLRMGDNDKDGNSKDATEAEMNERRLLGRGSSILDNIINSILNRAGTSTRFVYFAISAIILIVIIGGSASFGTVALNEANKVRELESERLKMLEIVNAIQTNDSSKSAERNIEVKRIISARYGDESSYKVILENIEKQSYVSWPDIAMRMTIAALTLFLVQIFFHIYKYNQQQASQLLTKAEVLELYKEPGADQVN